MKKNTTNKKLFTIVAKLVDVNINKINLNTNSENLDEYDSLAILNLATYFEKKSKKKKLKYDMKDFYSVKNLIKFLEKNDIKIWTLKLKKYTITFQKRQKLLATSVRAIQIGTKKIF